MPTIFHDVISVKAYTSSLDPTHPLWTIGHVSQMWRYTLLTHPLLWAAFRYNILSAFISSGTKERLRLYLQRSGECSLTIYLNIPRAFDNTLSHSTEVLKILAGEAGRWADIEFVFESLLYTLIVLLPKRLPRLRRLSIRNLIQRQGSRVGDWVMGGQTLEGDRSAVCCAFEKAPCLVEVHLQSEITLMLPWAQLVKFTGLASPELIQALGNGIGSSLVEASFYVGSSSLNVSMPIILKNVMFLELTIPSVRHSCPWFSQLRTPALERLVLKVGAAYGIHAIMTPFLARSDCRLRILEWTHSPQYWLHGLDTSHDFFDIFQESGCNEIETLKLDGSFTQAQLDYLCISTSNSQSELTAPQERRMRLPRLTSFTIIGLFDYDALFAALESRLRLPSESRVSRLKDIKIKPASDQEDFSERYSWRLKKLTTGGVEVTWHVCG
jgi:hypothetical protein